MPDPQTNRSRTWLGASLMTALSGDSGRDSGELRRTRPLLRGLGWSSSSSSSGARHLFRGADSLIDLSSAAAAGARAALRFLAANFLGAVAMGTAIIQYLTWKFENPSYFLHVGALFALIIYRSAPLYLWSRFKAGRRAIFRLNLRRGNNVGENVSSSIVPLLCSRLGLWEAGPFRGFAAFRLDWSKAPNEREKAGSLIVVSLSSMLGIPQLRILKLNSSRVKFESRMDCGLVEDL